MGELGVEAVFVVQQSGPHGWGGGTGSVAETFWDEIAAKNYVCTSGHTSPDTLLSQTATELFKTFPELFQILVTVQQTKSSDQLPTSKKEEIFRWQFV